MITTREKQDDLEYLALLLRVLSTTVRMYQKTGNPVLKEHADYFHSETTKLRHKLDTHDYGRNSAIPTPSLLSLAKGVY